MKGKSPIFILASERSGTNLLRTLLSNHSLLEGPVAAHLLHVFSKVKDCYGDLTIKDNMRFAFNHFIKSVNHLFTNWQLNVNFDTFYAKYHPATLITLFDVIHQEKVGEAVNYVCKDKNLYDDFDHLKKELPEAKFIYLCRDPRDYVASNLKTPRSLWTTWDNAKAWNHEQSKCLKILEENSDIVCLLKYEDLVRNTSVEMKRILNFIGFEQEEGCYQTDKDKSKDLTWNKHWENLDKPVMKSNFNKYKIELNSNQIKMIEFVCKRNMEQLGYSLDTDASYSSVLPIKLLNKAEHVTHKLKRIGYMQKNQRLSNEKTVLNKKLLEEARNRA